MQHKPKRRLGLERLEDRCTPATFTVNSILDTPDANPGDGNALDANGVTTLRAAIMEANALAWGDTIEFSLPNPSSIALETALPHLSDVLHIVGPGANQLTVTRAQGAPNFKIFTIDLGADVDLSGLSITRGRATSTHGGGIFNLGNLHLAACAIYDNYTKYSGGGICNVGTLTLIETSIYQNTAELQNGGGINSDSASATLTLASSNIYANSAGLSGGGIYVGGSGGLNGSAQITNNTAQWGGGVAAIESFVSLFGGVISDNTTIGARKGGGFYQEGGSASFNSVEIKNNSSSYGGGIYVYSGMFGFMGGKVEGNAAGERGGGFYVSSGWVNFSDGASVSSNSAKRGGGGYAAGGTTTMANCSLADNTATDLGPGIAFVLANSVTLTTTGPQGQVQDLNP